jgi:hypothetical protein
LLGFWFGWFDSRWKEICSGTRNNTDCLFHFGINTLSGLILEDA